MLDPSRNLLDLSRTQVSQCCIIEQRNREFALTSVRIFAVTLKDEKTKTHVLYKVERYCMDVETADDAMALVSPFEVVFASDFSEFTRQVLFRPIQGGLRS